jgi:hypothetical protein
MLWTISQEEQRRTHRPQDQQLFAERIDCNRREDHKGDCSHSCLFPDVESEGMGYAFGTFFIVEA